ncbi:sugar ABC transporter substrate-binding protein [Kibdelosporangium aridum]|uniref:Sugar ABC transporter substrate-binding protein n=1 Tax=Kibdelosporangium aridum TaxID=2030 RepID=A0A428Z484_KIBAR|nr:sugar ABC transporter substrate-binding protein [Kibdelosporangium aridum]RSM81238.1 sugar ABC transporter substrate-binding protein [Kibdelosporangium aridum]
MRSQRRLAAVLLAAGLAVTACSGDEGAAPAPTGKAELSFWGWDPNMDKVVEIWNAQNPDIHVTLTNPAGGDQLVNKMVTAHQAGNGPDIAKVEYQSLPALVSGGVVRDITEYTSDTVKDFDEPTLKATKFEGKVYGVPQDVAPLMLFYRTDLFQQYGLTVPKTWDEYAQAARALKQKAPNAFITNFDAADPGWFAGLVQQNGADWWSTSGTSWKVDINGEASKKVATYWEDLVKGGVVDKGPSFSPQWNKQMNDGTLATWISGAWAPAQFNGIAPDTKGKWAVAPLPTWQAGDKATGIWGGSAITVTTDSKRPAEAAKFVSWLNTNAEAVTAQIKNINVYPASTAGRSLPILTEPPPFMPNQTDYYDVIKQAAPNARSFPMWGPNVTVTFASYTDSFGKAMQANSPFTGALDAMQDATVADMKKLGFTLN